MLAVNDEKYIKKIAKYIQRNKEAKGQLPVTVFDKFDKDTNIALYDKLLDKLQNTVYRVRLSAQIKNLEKGRETFINLGIKEQVITLFEILHLFQCNSVNGDLTAIGGAKDTGTLKIGKNISELSKISIINQSPTGLFEQEIDLLKL